MQPAPSSYIIVFPKKTMQYDINFLCIAYKCTIRYLSLTKIFRNDQKYKNFHGFYVRIYREGQLRTRESVQSDSFCKEIRYKIRP